MFGFGGGRTNIPVNAANAASVRPVENPKDARDKAADEIKQIVSAPPTQPTPLPQDAARAGFDPLSQPVSPYGTQPYNPNGAYMGQPIAPPTGPATDPTAPPSSTTEAASNNNGGSGGTTGGSGTRNNAAPPEKQSPPPPSEPTASTQTSYYYFNRARALGAQQAAFVPASSNAPSGAGSRPTVKPPFTTKLPVRSQDAISTLTTGSTVTFELLRPMQGNGWALPRGTVFVGKTSGGTGDRAYVTIEGFIDPQNQNQLVAMAGEARGIDGAAGIIGQRKRLNAGWAKAVSKIVRQAGNAGVGITTSLLLGRNGGTTSIFNPPQDPFGANSGQAKEGVEFVYVPANKFGYIIVDDRPPTVQGAAPSLPGQQPQGEMTDEEFIQLLTTGTPDDVRRAMPRMAAPQRAAIEEALKGQP
jgi:hypothetical protein